MDQPVKIIQISDMHLFDDPKKSLLMVNTQDSFTAVIRYIYSRMSQPDLILLSGDLSQDGSKSSYERLAAEISQFKAPAYFIPGNHDAIEMMNNVYPLANISKDKYISLKYWQLILLNSQKIGKVEGYLAPEQLNFLKKCLEKNPKQHAMIVFHHQPVPVGATWLDNVGLKNANEFWQTIAPYNNVKAVVFGHVHQQYDGKKNNIPCFSAPSTCFQFKRDQADFGLEDLPPGFREIWLHADGHIETKVFRIDKYIGEFDCKATGY